MRKFPQNDAFVNNIPPVSVAEFEFALGLISAAAENRMQVTNPETLTLDLEEVDGSVVEYHIVDRPLTRGIVALQENLDTDVAWAATMRFWLLRRILSYPSISATYASSDATHTTVHPDLIEAIATVPWRRRRHPGAAAVLKRIKTIQAGRASA